MKISKMKDIFHLAYLSDDSIRMVGLHGIGKSDVVKQYCEEHNMHLETLFLSQNEVADLIGIPYQKGDVTYWSKPVWLKRMEDADKNGKSCVLFLDELARAPLEVRQAALQLVLDGKMHEHHLPKKEHKTLVIAADNPSDIYQTDDLDKALIDRFGNYNVEVHVEGWLDWARNNNIEPVIIDFIAEYPMKLHFIPEDDNDKGGTPRSWAKLSDYLKHLSTVDTNEYLYNIAESKVGVTLANNFVHFYNNYTRVLKPEDLVKALSGIKLTDKNSFQEATKKLKKLKSIKSLEALQAQELAEKLKKLAISDDAYMDIITVFLDTINTEVFVSIIKKWKDSKETIDFYFKWANTVPEGYIFKKVLKIRNELID